MTSGQSFNSYTLKAIVERSFLQNNRFAQIYVKVLDFRNRVLFDSRDANEVYELKMKWVKRSGHGEYEVEGVKKLAS